MHSNLEHRLRRVATFITLLERLRKVALSEEDMLTRMVERTGLTLSKSSKEFSLALNHVLKSLPTDTREPLAALGKSLQSVIPSNGIVSKDNLQQAKRAQTELWTAITSAQKMYGRNPLLLQLFGAYDKLLTVAMFATRIQDPKVMQLARENPKYSDRIYKAVESISQMLSKVNYHLKKIEVPPQKEQPQQEEKPQQAPEDNSNKLEEAKKQLSSIESDMRGILGNVSGKILNKANDIYGDSSGQRNQDYAEDINDNISTIWGNDGRIDPRLNSDKGWYQEALHLNVGASNIDIGDFLGSKNKKLLYLSYRSFVMGARALGLIQYLRKKPELVLKSEGARKAAIKVQEILRKRSQLILKKLSQMEKEEVEDTAEYEDPKSTGTFDESFSSPRVEKTKMMSMDEIRQTKERSAPRR